MFKDLSQYIEKQKKEKKQMRQKKMCITNLVISF